VKGGSQPHALSLQSHLPMRGEIRKGLKARQHREKVRREEGYVWLNTSLFQKEVVFKEKEKEKLLGEGPPVELLFPTGDIKEGKQI